MTIKDSKLFNEVAKSLSKALAVSYKKDFPSTNATEKELEKIFYDRITMPIEEKIKNKNF